MDDDVGRGDRRNETIDTYDRIARDYCKKTRLDKYLHWERSYIKRMLSMIGRADALVLDVGCGDGRHCRIVDEEGGRAVGIDLSPGMLEQARLYYPAGDFRLMDMCSLLFEDAQFDGLWSSGSIYHVSKTQVSDALGEFRRILKPGGVLSMSFKLGSGEGIEANPKSYGGSPRYFAYYSQDEMTELLSSAGFAVVETCLYPEEIFGANNLQMWLR